MKGKRVNAWHSVYGADYKELKEAEAIVQKKYGDILDCERPNDPSRKKASANSRAAQFSPFAALSGFEGEIAEEGRLTDMRIELSEEQKEQLDRTIAKLQAKIEQNPSVTAVIFREDEKKAGGSYVSVQGQIKKIDPVRGTLVFTDKSVIRLCDIVDLYAEGSETYE